MGYFCCSLFLAYLKFGVFTCALLGVLVFCELLFLYFSFLVGSLLYLNYYQIIFVVQVISLLVELSVPCQHLGTVLLMNRFAGCSWSNAWLLQNRLLKQHENKWWPTFIPSLLTEVSHQDLQSSTTPACSWQGTCSRTGQPASNCSIQQCWMLGCSPCSDGWQQRKPFRSWNVCFHLQKPWGYHHWFSCDYKMMWSSCCACQITFQIYNSDYVSIASFYQINKSYQRCLHFCIKYLHQCTIMKFGVWWGISKGLPKPLSTCTGTAQKTNISTRSSLSREPQLFHPMVIWIEQHSEQQCEC